MNKSAFKSYLIDSLKASASLTVTMMTSEEFRNVVSDKLIILTMENNKRLFKAPVVNPIGFSIRIAIRSLADAVEIHTIYDLDECTSPQVRQTLEACLNITAKGTKQSVADVLNITKDGKLPSIANRILIAFARHAESEDSETKLLIQKVTDYFKNIHEHSQPSEQELEALMSDPRYSFTGKHVVLKHKFDDASVSPFDDNYVGPIF